MAVLSVWLQPQIKPQINSLTRQDVEFPLESKSDIVIWVLVQHVTSSAVTGAGFLLHNKPLCIENTVYRIDLDFEI